MDIRVEGDKLIREYEIEKILYTPADGERVTVDEGITHWAQDSLAVILTAAGAYSLSGARADELRDHRLAVIRP